MTAIRTDLGVVVGPNGFPIHRRECSACEGAGRFLVEVGPAHAPRDFYERCEECNGEGSLLDTDCDCSICVQVAEDMEAHGHA